MHFTSLIYVYASVNWVSIGSNNGLSPGRRQAIIWTNADILSNITQSTHLNFKYNFFEIFPFTKMHLNISSAKWLPFLHFVQARWVNAIAVVATFGGCRTAWERESLSSLTQETEDPGGSDNSLFSVHQEVISWCIFYNNHYWYDRGNYFHRSA